VAVQLVIVLLLVLVTFRYAVYPPDHAVTLHPAVIGATVAAWSCEAPDPAIAVMSKATSKEDRYLEP
jgi:hypothetical protein